jgi:periplasmic protein TonB
VASAVDSRRSAAAPSASSAKPVRVGSPAVRKSNPVAHEIPVIATGARPGDTNAQRQLFTEETSTVLVFENGAVIRLSAAVAAGQLVFLTNKESRREVVAQVTRKRDFRPTSCYVELEFSEPAPGFWGIHFPEDSELVPANAHQQEAAELVQASRTVAGKPGASAPAPSAQEVDALKQEVEALRQQLKSLQTQTAAKSSSALPASAAASPATKSPATPVLSNAPVQTGLRREDSPKPPAAPPEPPATVSPLSSRVAPPRLREREATASFEDHPFPRPEIRINRGKPSLARSPRSKLKSRPSGSFRPEAVRAALIFVVLLLGAAGAAWYINWIPWLAQPKKFFATATIKVLAHLAPAVTPVPAKPADAHPDSTKPAQLSDVSVSKAVAASTNTSQPASLEGAKPSNSAEHESSVANDRTAVAPALEQKSAITPAAAKRAVPRSSENPDVFSEQPLSQSAAVVPPKLIKSVRAVASPFALKYFDKDNTVTVTVDALVDSSGRVKSMNVLSGPASLRDAAMNALRQYRYAPARQGGKRVAAHVTVPIKFLFEP